MNSKFAVILAASLLLLVALFGALNLSTPVAAAPSFAPTPVSADRSPEQPHVAVLMDSQVITQDTRSGCVNSAWYERADVQYEVDEGATNTATLKLQFTNETPGDAGTSYVDGLTIATASADTTSMQQMQVFGAWTCVYADLSNANAMTISIKALLK